VQQLTTGGAQVSIDALGEAVTCRNAIMSLRTRGHHLPWPSSVDRADHLGHKNIRNTRIHAQNTTSLRQEVFAKLERYPKIVRVPEKDTGAVFLPLCSGGAGWVRQKKNLASRPLLDYALCPIRWTCGAMSSPVDI